MKQIKENIVSTMKNKFLIPFYLTVLIYFVQYKPYWDYPPITFGAAFFKVLPVWSLVFYIRMSSGPNLIGFFPKDDYNKFIMTGLIISGFGDAFMISRDTLLLPGILSFSFAHAFYLHAMDDVPYCNRLTSLFILGFLDTFLLLYKDIGSVFVMFIFLLYLTLIFITGWKAATVYETKPDSGSFACAVGMLCFMFSDFILAIDLWKFHIPLSELIVMSFYYSAQLFIALSTVLRNS